MMCWSWFHSFSFSCIFFSFRTERIAHEKGLKHTALVISHTAREAGQGAVRARGAGRLDGTIEDIRY